MSFCRKGQSWVPPSKVVADGKCWWSCGYCPDAAEEAQLENLSKVHSQLEVLHCWHSGCKHNFFLPPERAVFLFKWETRVGAPGGANNINPLPQNERIRGRFWTPVPALVASAVLAESSCWLEAAVFDPLNALIQMEFWKYKHNICRTKSILIIIYLLILCVYVVKVPSCTCRGQRTTFRRGFSLSTMDSEYGIQVLRLGDKYYYHLTDPLTYVL